MTTTQSTVTIELPWPCSVNHYYFTANVRGRLVRLIGKEGKQYQRSVRDVIANLGSPRLEGDLRIDELVLYPPTRARRDIDNVLKCLWDSMQDREDKKMGTVERGLFHDDCQIREYRNIRWGPVVDGGKVSLQISVIPLAIFQFHPAPPKAPAEKFVVIGHGNAPLLDREGRA